MAIKETDNTTKYNNLAIKTSQGADKIVEFLSGLTKGKIEFNASEYDAVVGFFEGKEFSIESAKTIAYIILRQSKIDNVPVFEVLDTLGTVTSAQLSQLVTEILNTNRYKTSVLGYKNPRTTQDHISRNIKA